jgi:hypothetical protein
MHASHLRPTDQESLWVWPRRLHFKQASQVYSALWESSSCLDALWNNDLDFLMFPPLRVKEGPGTDQDSRVSGLNECNTVLWVLFEWKVGSSGPDRGFGIADWVAWFPLSFEICQLLILILLPTTTPTCSFPTQPKACLDWLILEPLFSISSWF